MPDVLHLTAMINYLFRQNDSERRCVGILRISVRFITIFRFFFGSFPLWLTNRRFIF